MKIRSAFMAGFAFAIGVGSVPVAKAGLLEMLFGGRPSTPVVSQNPNVPSDYYRRPILAEHPVVTVKKPVRTARRVVRVKTPQLSPQQQLAVTIDPVKNPYWYLQDQTLRKGDILVLNDRVLVFKGGVIGEQSSYVALRDTRLLSKKERLVVAQMAGQEKVAPALTAETAPSGVKKIRAADLLTRLNRG